MAKKKTPPAVAATIVAPLPGEKSPDKVESLKTLNRLLLKETAERREQVHHLKSCLEHLSQDQSLSSDLERGITSIVVTSRLAELTEEMAATEARARSVEAALGTAKERLESVAREKDVVEKALDVAALERDSARADRYEKERLAEARVAAVRDEAQSDLELTKAFIRSLEAEKAVMEETIISTEKYLRSANERLQSITREKDEIEKDLQRAITERGACKTDLAAVSSALQTAQEKIESSQSANFALKEEIARMQHEFEEDKIKFVMEVDGLKERVRCTECKKEGLEQENVVLESKVACLQGRVSELQAIVQEKVALEKELSLAEEALRRTNEHLDHITAERDGIKKALDQAISERDFNQIKLAEEEKRKAVLLKETESSRMEFGSLKKVKERLQLDIEAQKRDYVKELDGLRDVVKKVELEKVELNRLRAEEESENANLQMAVAKHLSTVSGLQDLCRAQTEKNAQLQTDEESVLRDLNHEKAEVNGLRLLIEELKRNKGDVHNELRKVKASLDRLITENKNLKIDFDSLTTEKSSLEAKLRNTLKIVEQMEGNNRVADKKLGKIWSLLKGTSEVVNDLEEGKGNGIGQEISGEEELDENIRNLADELDKIKMAFKNRVAKTKDMDQELKVMRCAMAEAKKKGGAWTWLYPGVTFLAAISIAYATKSW